MAKQVVDLGTVIANGSDGDTAREAFTKVNANFTEVYDKNQEQDQALVNKVDKVVGKSLVDDAEIAKLATVAANATQNSTDSFLLDRANHTGSQAISTIDGLQTSLNSKVDQVSLGTAAFESADAFEKTLVEGIGITIDRTNPAAPVISSSGGGGGGSGDVVGPMSSVNNEVALFNGTSGKFIKGGGALGTAAFTASTDYAPVSHVGSGGSSHANVIAGGASGFMTGAQATKLDGIQAGAQVNTVASVAGKTGEVSLVKADVGLGDVDNTSDLNKPISTATQTALNGKQDTLVSATNIKTINGNSLLGAGNIEIAGGGGGDASPLFSVMWWPQRAAIPAGYVAADGQTLSRATYPDAWAGITAGNVPTVADATWISTPTERGKFTTGDGSTTFRLPDYNGKSAGSLGAVFLRGDGTLSAEIAGVIQRDALQDHVHPVRTGAGSAAVTPGTGQGVASLGTPTSNGDVTADNRYDNLGNDNTSYIGLAGLLPANRTASETRTLNVTGCWVIKLFGAVVNVGSADAAQLASDYANLASRVSTLEAVRPAIRTAVGASGTSVAFTGIPSWVNKITAVVSEVSTNGASIPMFQVGSGSFTTSGYLGCVGVAAGGSTGNSALTTGVLIDNGGISSASIIHGNLTFTRCVGNTWTFSGVFSLSNTPRAMFVSGSVALTNSVDRIRLTTVNGTDQFDAGTINILYEE